MTTFLRLTSRDPLVARDGRPFGAGQGNRMRSADWLYPSVVAGSFRTVLGKAAEKPFDRATQADLLKISVAGVFPLFEGELYLRAPHDCVLGAEVYRARPDDFKTGEGSDWPMAGLRPVLLDTENDFKPETGPTFWPVNRYAEWLTGTKIDPRQDNFLNRPVEDLRDHVSLDADTGAAEEGLLFTTSGIGTLALPRFGRKPRVPKPTGEPLWKDFAPVELAARVHDVPAWGRDGLAKLSVWHPLGGERRLVHWQTHDLAEVWRCPPRVTNALATTNRVSLTLATPAIFTEGWKPNWVCTQLPSGPKLTLVAVCSQRWQAVSGWSYQDSGPKAIRRMVPAGSVYFFESDRSDNSSLRDHWLQPISDDEQERRDGFGLAVWGTWEPLR